MVARPSFAEEEIDLKECLRVVSKRKKTVFAICFLFIATAVLIDMNTPKIYRVISTVQIGSIDAPLVNKDDAKAYIVNQNALLSVIRQLNLKVSLEKLQKDIQISDVEGTNLLRIRTSYPDIETVYKISGALVEPFVAQGSAMYQKRLAIIIGRLKELDDEIERTTKNIGTTQDMALELYKIGPAFQNDASLKIVLLQNTLSGYENHLNYLRNQRHELMLLMDHAKDFKIFDTSVVPQESEGLGHGLILIAVFIGLFLGIFTAFFAEFLHKNREV